MALRPDGTLDIRVDGLDDEAVEAFTALGGDLPRIAATADSYRSLRNAPPKDVIDGLRHGRRPHVLVSRILGIGEDTAAAFVSAGFTDLTEIAAISRHSVAPGVAAGYAKHAATSTPDDMSMAHAARLAPDEVGWYASYGVTSVSEMLGRHEQGYSRYLHLYANAGVTAIGDVERLHAAGIDGWEATRYASGYEGQPDEWLRLYAHGWDGKFAAATKRLGVEDDERRSALHAHGVRSDDLAHLAHSYRYEEIMEALEAGVSGAELRNYSDGLYGVPGIPTVLRFKEEGVPSLFVRSVYYRENGAPLSLSRSSWRSEPVRSYSSWDCRSNVGGYTADEIIALWHAGVDSKRVNQWQRHHSNLTVRDWILRHLEGEEPKFLRRGNAPPRKTGRNPFEAEEG